MSDVSNSQTTSLAATFHTLITPDMSAAARKAPSLPLKAACTTESLKASPPPLPDSKSRSKSLVASRTTRRSSSPPVATWVPQGCRAQQNTDSEI